MTSKRKYTIIIITLGLLGLIFSQVNMQVGGLFGGLACVVLLQPFIFPTKKQKIAIKKKQLDKLTNDPEYQKILKKYNIEPVPYGKDFSLGDLKSFKK